MDLLAVELIDAGICAARTSRPGLLPVEGQHRSSPGFARIRKKDVVTGLAAARQACLHPLEINTRFWDQLDLEPAAPKIPGSPNRAEVAFAHLRQVIERVRRPDDRIVMAVPPSYDEWQLRILVGIARELQLPLQGLVATPVAYDPGPDFSGTVLVVEVLMHRSVLTIVEIGDEHRLVQTRVCPDIGRNPLQRQWARAISGEFVRHTRFDPLYHPAVEQELHDALTRTLDTLAGSGSCSVQLEAGSLSHRVTVTEQLLAQSGHALIFKLGGEIQSIRAAHPFTSILLTDEAARVPGLRRMLEQQNAVPVHALDAGAAARGLAGLWPDRFDQSITDAVAYHTRRGCGDVVEAGKAGTPSRPTHALVGGEAHPLRQEPLFLDVDPQADRLTLSGASGVASLRVDGPDVVLEIQAGREVRVNGTAAEGPLAVGTGTEISLPGCAQTMTLITLTG